MEFINCALSRIPLKLLIVTFDIMSLNFTCLDFRKLRSNIYKSLRVSIYLCYSDQQPQHTLRTSMKIQQHDTERRRRSHSRDSLTIRGMMYTKSI